MIRPAAIFSCIALLAAASCLRAVTDHLEILCYHDVRDDVHGILDPDQFAINTKNLVRHFDWLKAQGYTVVSLQQVIEARHGGAPLPEKPVLLTFDDGLRSMYTRVFPLLKAYGYPAVASIVGAWVEMPEGETVNYGHRLMDREDFLTWAQIREMHESGLVEIASHSHNLHHGVLANPQRNEFPAAITHIYHPESGRYESTEEYKRRIRDDLQRSVREITAATGSPPRAIAWPYGAFNMVTDDIAEDLGMPVTFALDVPRRPTPYAGTLQGIPRVLLMSNPTVDNLSYTLRGPGTLPNIRAMQVDLDYVYDPDPVQQNRNLSQLIERVRAMGANQVWLQAFADVDGDDAAEAVYFPNRHMPLRADLFSRVAWQLRTRAGVKVFAWLPVLAWHLPDAAQAQRLGIHPRKGHSPQSPVRLNPFLPETRQIVGDLYEDALKAVPAAGILFHDDAILRDTDDLGEHNALSPAGRTDALIAFTTELTARASRWQPQLITARNLFARPILEPHSEEWFAQSLPAFLRAYDQVAVMAMPYMEGVGASGAWLRRLAQKVAAIPGAFDRVVFELQAFDWRGPRRRPILSATMAAQMRLLQIAGARHIAYYPDDFLTNHPDLETLRRVFSAEAYPFEEGAKPAASQ